MAAIVKIIKRKASEKLWRFAENCEETIRKAPESINLLESSLAKELRREIEAYPVCRCCRGKVAELFEDYRNNCGCVRKFLICAECRRLNDEMFWTLCGFNDLNDFVEIEEIVLALLKE